MQIRSPVWVKKQHECNVYLLRFIQMPCKRLKKTQEHTEENNITFYFYC